MSDQPEAPDSARPKRPRWRRILRGVVLTALGLFATVLVVWAVWSYVAARQLRDEIARIRAAGEPLTFKELDAALPNVEPGDDAGRFYAAGLALVVRDWVYDTWKSYCDAVEAIPPTGRPADELLDKADRVLADHRLTLEMFDKGAALLECRFDVGIEQGMQTCLERMARARTAARLLSLRTRHLAVRGEGDAAVDSLICSLRMSRMFDRQPVVLVHLVKTACMAVACDDAKAVLERGDASNESLTRLQAALSTAWPSDALTRMAMAERVHGLELMQNVIAGAVGRQPPQAGFSTIPERWPASFGSAWARHLAAAYLRDMSELVAKTRQPWADVIADALATEVAEPSVLMLRLPNPADAIRRARVLTGNTVAYVRWTMAAVMIERYRRANGRLPASLADLTPTYAQSVPLDPFTGKELVYRADDRGYVVYSVGEDRTDDGGAIESEGPGKRPRDRGVRIRLPSAR